ncbi:hypothetical protein DL98DRAFT_542088 [Cadophora sp. DSE1049]|nr:hypothetical protein DL98DRAFT_542088 [Cadophora sp. DSE1049]
MQVGHRPGHFHGKEAENFAGVQCLQNQEVTWSSKCDGVRPKCSGCAELGFECVYVNPASSSNVIVGKEYLSGLEGRLKAVEQDLKILKSKPNRPQQHPRFEDELGDGPGPCPRNLQSEEVEVNSSELQDSLGLENAADGMGAMEFSVEEDCGFFGPSSNIAFTRHVSRAMNRMNRSVSLTGASDSPGIPLDNAVISISQPSSPPARAWASRSTAIASNQDNVNIYALPSEVSTRGLITRYFKDTGLLFPYIDEQAFLDTYNELNANGFIRIRRTWLGLLNMIMAMATSTTIDNGWSAEKRARDSEIYHQRAAGLCEKQITRGTSLETVQYLLLTGQYLQVKAALQLGLHSTAASSRFSFSDREFRKRTWYGCVVLDRTLSMTFGRPATIPDNYIRISLPQGLGTEGSSGSQDLSNNLNHETSVAFFNATITLYRIMWNVIDQLYSSNIGCDNQATTLDTISQLFLIEQQLCEWERQLPPSLTLSRTNNPMHQPNLSEYIPSSLGRFRIILKLRHNNVRILLHRPILVKLLDILGKAPVGSDIQEANLMQQLGSNSVQICVQSSVEIIAIVRTILLGKDEHRSLLGAWWFSLYYTFNAALVVFASFLVLKDRNANGAMPLLLAVSEHDLHRSLVDAAAALRRMDYENMMADRCALYLERLASVSETLTLTNMFSETSTSGDYSLYPDSQVFGSEPGIMNASLLGMDLGEFMLEGDLEILNQITYAQQAQGMNKVNGVDMGVGGSGHLDSGGSLLL